MLSDRVLDEHLDRIDYYTLLDVARDASTDAIRDAFHRFAMRFHPDQHIGDDGAQVRAARIFKRGAEGYRVLIDAALRARYDAALGRGEVRLSQEAERKAVVAEAKSPAADTPLPPDVKSLYDKAREAFDRGDLKNAKAFLTLVTRRSTHPKVQGLAREVLEAERNALRKR